MSRRVFVDNLPRDLGERALLDIFSPFGAVTAAIAVSSRGKSQGFGFVDMADDQVCDAIAFWNGRSLAGSILEVKEARPRVDRDP